MRELWEGSMFISYFDKTNVVVTLLLNFILKLNTFNPVFLVSRHFLFLS